MKTYHWDVLATFHWDLVGCFIWDVPATLLGCTKRRHYDIATTSHCWVGVTYFILHLWTRFQCHAFFPSQDIKQNEFLFRQLMTSWTLRFIFDHPLKQWPTGRKRGKDRNTKNWISREWKELFRLNKKHFS